MPSISELKAELKRLNAEYAKIKDMPAEKRADFGKELNVKKQNIMQQIADAEAAAEDQEVFHSILRPPATLMLKRQFF